MTAPKLTREGNPEMASLSPTLESLNRCARVHWLPDYERRGRRNGDGGGGRQPG
jgi:hypothetical protein